MSLIKPIRHWLFTESNLFRHVPLSPRNGRGRRRKAQGHQPGSEQLESRVLLSASLSSGGNADGQNLGATPGYSIDGTGNNPFYAEWGSTDEQLLRATSVAYADGISWPSGDDRPNPRAISNAVNAQTDSIENDRQLSDYIWIWGQFIDHDLDLTEAADPHEPWPISVPQGDPYFDPFGTGTAEIDFTRSTYDHASGTSLGNPRQQINQITAFLDGSVIYGSDDVRAAALRTFEGGKLKTSDGDLLPYNTLGLPNAGGTSDSLFLAGDVRANENVALSSMHTIFVREHNRIADEIAQHDPQLNDEELYQRARSIVIAELQAITYNEFLPALLGADALTPYRGYDPDVNPGIMNVFSTAVYRLGHSLLSPELIRLDADGEVIAEGNLALRDAFFRPDELAAQGIDSILRGAATQTSQELDTQIIDDVRNFLFGPPGSGGFDLASLNIQRGRDHGLPSYNQARMDLGLAPVTSFDQITSDPDVQARLESVYDHVDEVDIWVGALAEDHLPGSSTGELIRTVLVDQFERIRAGDRFWYQRSLSGADLHRVENTTLADVIERNSGVSNLQRNVFYSADPQQPADDVVAFDRSSGRWLVGASTGTQFEQVVGPRWSRHAGWQTFAGDFNGDGLTDVAGLNRQREWWVGLNDGATFQTRYFGRWNASGTWYDIRVGDFNGDGQDDVVGRFENGDWWIGRSLGESFQNTYAGRWTATGWTDVVVGDFNGDHRDDLAGRRPEGYWYVAQGTNERFATSLAGRWSGTAGWQDVVVGDFNGDRLDDIAGRTSAGYLWYGESNGSRFQNVYGGRWAATGWQQVVVADVDADGRDDLVGLNHRRELWFNHLQSNETRITEFLDRWQAGEDYLMTVGDYDGDGRDDIAGLNTWDHTWVVTSQGPEDPLTRIFGWFDRLGQTDFIASGNIV